MLLEEAKGVNSTRFDLSNTVIRFIAKIMDKCFAHQIEPEFDIVWFKGSRKELGHASAIKNRTTGKYEVIEIAINDSIPMPQLVFESVVLHELVHILMFQTGKYYVGHGRDFTDACKVIESKHPEYAGMIAGAEMDFVRDFEAIGDEKTKPFNVVVLADESFRNKLALFGFAFSGNIDADIKALENEINDRTYQKERQVWMFTTDRKVFKTMLPPIARKLDNVTSFNSYRKEHGPYIKSLEDEFVYGFESVNGKVVRELIFRDLPI